MASWDDMADAVLERVRRCAVAVATEQTEVKVSADCVSNCWSLSRASSRSLAASCDAMCSAITGDAAARLTETWRSTTSRSNKARAVGSYFSEVLKAAGLGWIPATVMVAVFVQQSRGSQAKSKGFAAALLVMLVLDCLLYRWQQRQRTAMVLVVPWNPRNLLAAAIQASACGSSIFACKYFGLASVASVAGIGWAAVAAADYKMLDFRHEVGIEDEKFSVALNRFRIYSFSPAKVMLEWSNVPDDIPKDMCCPISHAPFVEPVICHNMVFEKEHLVTWIVERGEHPMLQGKRVSLVGLRPCVEMKQLVEAYASSCNMKKVVVPDS